MKNLVFALGALCVAGAVSANEHAESEDHDEHHFVDELVVTATPLERSVEQLAQPTSVISGDALTRNQASSIGETLADQPGVTASYFGPVSSRPIIRGQYGERVRVLSNGLDALDASALSEDHAVSLDSILADSVEIVRGPATLLYGSGAAGGLVNIVDSRIREKPLDQTFSGALSASGDTATGRRSAAAKVDFGNENIAAHFDYFVRETDDIEIPGFAESAILRALEEEEGEEHEEEEVFGTAENTSSEAQGGALAVTFMNDAGFTGFSVNRYDNEYGIPGHHHHEHEEGAEEELEEDEEAVRVDLEQLRYDVKGEYEIGSAIDSVRFRAAYNDYTHRELEGEEVGTMFDSQGIDVRVELRHQPLGPFDGAVGTQYKRIDFVAEGEEAFVPASLTEQLGVFAFEEVVLSDTLTLQASARAEHQDISAGSLPGYDDWAFGGSVGAVLELDESLKLSANFALTERHPNSTELYADGPHVAVQRVERGSVSLGNGLLDKEKSSNVDVTLRGAFNRFEFSVTGFVNLIDDYILLAPTSEFTDEYQVFEYSQTDVRMQGLEAELLFEILPEGGRGHLHGRLMSDIVSAEQRETRANLPRIPPVRVGAGLHYLLNGIDASIEAIWHDEQTDTAANELPTESYTLVNAEVSGRVLDERLLVFLKGTNLGDEDARRHSSPLKDLVPLPGRSVHLGMRWDF